MQSVIVVMGVSGSSKSAVGARLALRLGVPFCEGDDLYPATNVAKMASGHALDDDDRARGWTRSIVGCAVVRWAAWSIARPCAGTELAPVVGASFNEV